MMIPALLLSITPTPSPALPSCQTMYDALPVAQREPVPNARVAMDMQLTALQSLCRGWAVVDLWETWDDHGRRQLVWHARRTLMDPWGHLTRAELDSIACPVLLDRLERLRQVPVTLEPGLLRLDPPSRTPVHLPIPPATDGTDYTITMPSAPQTGLRSQIISNARVTVSTSSGPVADWALATEQALATCWCATS